MLDVVHMMKLLRNLLGEYKTLHLDGEAISWTYIQVCIDDCSYVCANSW